MQTSSGIFGAETVEIYKGDKAIIVGVDIKRNMYKTRVGGWQLQDSLDELERLCKTAGIEVVSRDVQNMQNPSSSTFIGSGKVDEIALAIQKGDVQAVVFDDELSPGQQVNYSSSQDCKFTMRLCMFVDISSFFLSFFLSLSTSLFHIRTRIHKVSLFLLLSLTNPSVAKPAKSLWRDDQGHRQDSADSPDLFPASPNQGGKTPGYQHDSQPKTPRNLT